MKRSWHSFYSLRAKLISTAIVVEVIMLSLLVWNSMRLTEKFLLDQLEHRVQQLQPLLNASLAGPLLQEDLVTLQEIMRQFNDEEVRYLSVFNAAKEHMVSVGVAEVLGDRALPDKNITRYSALEAGTYVLRIPILLADRIIGRLDLELDARFISRAIGTVREQGATIALVGIGLSVLVLSLLGLALTRGLQDLTGAVRKMSDGDMSVRIDVKSRDEVGEAAATFNRMADYIAQNQKSLRDSEGRIRKLNEKLEQRVETRTSELQASNRQLQQSLEKLQRAQEHIVQTEKMAALGGLVAGVAHEINTPLGVSVTAASHLKSKIATCAQRYNDDKLTRGDFEAWLRTTDESASMILANLERAANHIRSFKQIAVDQSDDELRRFNLKDYLQEVLQSLQPQLKKTRHEIDLIGPDDLELNSHPGAFSQILTNLVMNSLIHGFEGVEKGHISIEVEPTADGQVRLCYSDNGVGIPRDALKRVFEPFFSTRRGQGGSGLGLHIVYNLVTQTLGGHINCTSVPGQDTRFEILLPRS